MRHRTLLRPLHSGFARMLIAMIFGPGVAHAGVMEFVNIPLLVNAYPQSTLDAAETTAAVKRMNEIYKPAKIKFTLVKRIVPPANPGNGNGIWTKRERKIVRAAGAKELVSRFGKGKGVKVSVAQQPDDQNAKVSGNAIKRNPTAIMRENDSANANERAEKSAQTMAHELGHVLGLGDTYLSSFKHLLMYGYPSGRTNVLFTTDQKVVLKRHARRRGKAEKMVWAPVPTDPMPPTTTQPKKSGAGTSALPDDALPDHEKIRMASLDGLDDGGPDDLLLTLILDDNIPATPPAPAQYQILFDNDGNPATGQTILGHPGIDRVLSIQVNDPLTLEAQLLDDLLSPVAPPEGIGNLGILLEVESFSDDTLDPLIDPPPVFPPGDDFIEIEILSMPLVASDAIVVSGPLSGPVLDEFAMPYSPAADAEGPHVRSSFGQFERAAPLIDIIATQFAPLELVDVFLDDDLLATFQADAQGALDEPLALPLGLLDTFYFVTAQGQTSEDFGFFVVSSDLPVPALPTLARFVLLGGILLASWAVGRKAARRTS